MSAVLAIAHDVVTALLIAACVIVGGGLIAFAAIVWRDLRREKLARPAMRGLVVRDRRQALQPARKAIPASQPALPPAYHLHLHAMPEDIAAAIQHARGTDQ